MKSSCCSHIGIHPHVVFYFCFLVLNVFCRASLAFLCTTTCWGKGFTVLHASIGTSQQNINSKNRQNENAQKIFSLIMERYNGTEVCIDFNDEEWRKAKRYIYYATSSSSTKHPLSVEQVVAVLDFLDETFGANRVNHQYQNKNTDIDSVFILKSVPRILRKDPERFIKPTVNFLKELYGPMFSQFVQRRPDLVIASGVGYNGRKKAIPPDHQTLVQVEECFLETNVEVYLEKNLCLSSAELSTLKKKHPSLFEISMKKLHGTVDYLRSVIRMGSEEYCQDDAIIGKIIKANPNILNLSLENIQAKIMFLSDLGFDAGENMRALLKKYPGILGLSLDRNLRPTTTALLEYYTKAMDEESSRKFVKKTIALHPQLLALSPANFAAKINYFDKLDCGDSLGIDMIVRDPKSSLALKLLMAAPSVYSLSLENIQEKVSYLSGLWSTDVSRPTVDRPVVAKQISDFPAVLTLSLEGNLQPTIAFYNRTGYIQDGRTTLPGRYLASSLYNRLLPRWNYFLKFDQKIDEDTEYRSQEVTGRLPLHILAGASDQIFCKRMKYSYEDYMKFKKEAVPILKFSSQFDTWISTGRPIDLDDND